MGNWLKPVLIIGASGQVGRACREELEAQGRRVVGTYATNPAHGLIPLDLRRPEEMRSLVRHVSPDLCVISSALTHVDRCESEPALATSINADAVEVLASECRDVGARVVHLSTEYVFDGESGPYDEESLPRPINAYGRSKLEGERRTLGADSSSLVVRTTVVYSWNPNGSNFVMQVLRNLKAGKRMRVPTDQRSSPTWAPDLARAIVQLYRAGASGVWNVAGPEVLPRYGFALQVAAAFGLDKDLLEPVPTHALGQAAKRPLNAGLRTERLCASFGRLMRPAAEVLSELRERVGTAA
jgi:dTDP-4-dehydrorhamnose reductase